jgi:acyl dehydratase
VRGGGGTLYSVELEPISFDDLPLGGEWTTRRRTISESEIALFAGVAGDFSPLTIDTSNGEERQAPPAMLIALAVGLGSIDMPIPQVATWEWLSWKFPKPVRAGDTIYARWTLTQKRPPVHGAKTGIAVWRVDVHTLDGAMAAEGEVGAAIVRRGGAPAERPAAEVPGQPRRRRRGRRGSGQAEVATAPAAAPAPAPQPAAQPAAASPERPPRRRRRKRGSGSGGNGNGGNHTAAAEPAPAAPLPPVAAPEPSQPRAARMAADANPISRVMKRLRRS